MMINKIIKANPKLMEFKIISKKYLTKNLNVK